MGDWLISFTDCYSYNMYTGFEDQLKGNTVEYGRVPVSESCGFLMIDPKSEKCLINGIRRHTTLNVMPESAWKVHRYC